MISALGIKKNTRKKIFAATEFILARSSRFGNHSENHLKFSNITGFILADCSRFGPPPAISSRVGTPGSGDHSLSGSDGYHNECGSLPLSIASNTRRSSPRDPVSAGRWPGHTAKDTEPGTTLGSKVNPRSTSMVYYASPFLRRMYHTPAHGIPCEQGDNTSTQANLQLDDGNTDG